MKRYLLQMLMAVAVSFSAYAQDLQVSEKLIQPVGASLETHIGGQVFKVIRTSPLPNAFGKADIFGRTIDRGSLELRYQGLALDGKVVLRLVEVDVRSNETTMNRNPVGVTSGSASTSLNPGGTSSTTRGTAVTIAGQAGRNEMLPPNATEFSVDIQKKRDLRFGSITVNIIDADETSMKYSLQASPKQP